METRLESIDIAVDDQTIRGTVLSPAPVLPGIMFVHGWGGSQYHDLVRAREAAALGAVCLTFDLRGHEDTATQKETVSREQNLNDLLAAYDWLASQPNVDTSAIAVIGISYGGYLAALLTERRPVRWLALRSAAIYKDGAWDVPKLQLNADEDLHAYRRRPLRPEDNVALMAASRYRGDVLLVEAEKDDIVPPRTTENFRVAFSQANSLTSCVLADADHGLAEKSWQQAYTRHLLAWLSEMIVGTRGRQARALVQQNKERVKGMAASVSRIGD